MNAANYCMALRHRLFLLMLVEGEHWRAHSKQIFKYKSGAWVQASALEINAWDVFLATEGLFICIADIMEQQDVQLKWKWDDVQATVAQLLNAHEGPRLEAWIRKAKESSDHLRATTQNKSWKATWPRRVSEMLSSFRCQWDSTRVTSLSKLFLDEWDSQLPKSRGA